MENTVDVVVSYVDPSTPGWEELRAKYKAEEEPGKDKQGLHLCRYRKNNPLRLQLQLIRKNMAFVRTIFVVCPTKAHCANEDLTGLGDVRVVEDGDIVPKEYMPVFNSHAVELFMHRIEGLAEEFVYFNDDMFVASPVTRADFITKKGALRVTVTPRSDLRVRADPQYGDPVRVSPYAKVAEDSTKLAWTVYGNGATPPQQFYWLDHAPFMFFRSDNERALKALLKVKSLDDLVTRFRDLERNVAVPQYYSFYSAFKRGWKMRRPEDFQYFGLGDAGLFYQFMCNRKRPVKFFCLNDTEGVKPNEVALYADLATKDLEWTLAKYPIACTPDWKKLFDRIYCLHYIGHKERLPALSRELTRVGIIGSGIFEMRYTTNDPFEKFVENAHRKLATLPEQNRAYTSILVNYARILRESIALGYKRILVLEDDLMFLKDLDEVRRIFNATPDADVVQYNCETAGGFWDTHKYVEWIEEHKIDDVYADPDGQWLGSSACVAYTAQGMKDVLAYMEKTYNCPDSSFRAAKSYVIAHRQPAIQYSYPDSALLKLFKRDVHHETLVTMGVDVSEYATPGDYTRPKRSAPPVNTPITENKKEHKMKICVYAITKNESKFVDRWVDSMQEADEIHVIDTGSTDDTVEKLKARGVHVTVKTYDPWRFDVPRNDAMALCPADTDVYVSTDLDEYFIKGWREKLEKNWKPDTTIMRYDYIWGWNSDGSPSHKFRYEKIHTKDYEWRYPVHELLFRKDGLPSVYAESDILLEHHPDPTKSRGSYLGLLELSVKEDPTNARNTHYLARELTFYHKWDEAIGWHKKYLLMKGWSAERCMTMRQLAECYVAKGDEDLAELWVRRAMDEDPKQREAAFWYADLLIKRQEWTRATRVLTKMLHESGTVPPENYVTNRTAWGWRPYDMLGMALWYGGHREEARRVYEAACAKFPDAKQLADNLKACGGSATNILKQIGLA